MIRRLLRGLLAGFIFFLLIEGAASVFIVFKALAGVPFFVMETGHAHYDELLGWSNIPNYRHENFYGPELAMRINSQGFRNDRDFSEKVPAGKIRVICSGDSFTLGYGVGNRGAWCEQLAGMDPKLEPVNMGQGGYGLDQIYLWYLRDGTKLDHQIHLFAFIVDDFSRMNTRKYFDVYDKPLLRIREGRLVNENVPVPRSSLLRRTFGALRWHMTGAISQFNFYRVFKILKGKIARNRKDPFSRMRDYEKSKPMALKIFEELKALNNEKGRVLVLILLPRFEDVILTTADGFREQIRLEAEKRGILLLDLVQDFRAIPQSEARTYFTYHYTAAGNRFVAGKIYEFLKTRKLLT